MSDYLAVSKHIIESDRAILAAVVGDGRTVAHLKQYQRENLSQGMAQFYGRRLIGWPWLW